MCTFLSRVIDRGSDNWLIKIEEPESSTVVSNIENPKSQGAVSQGQVGIMFFIL